MHHNGYTYLNILVSPHFLQKRKRYLYIYNPTYVQQLRLYSALFYKIIDLFCAIADHGIITNRQLTCSLQAIDQLNCRAINTGIIDNCQYIFFSASFNVSIRVFKLSSGITASTNCIELSTNIPINPIGPTIISPPATFVFSSSPFLERTI